MDAQDTHDMLKYGSCNGSTCNGKNPGQPPHMCPYAMEFGDDNTLCNCCGECECGCVEDI